jgi:hypothetical protein
MSGFRACLRACVATVGLGVFGACWDGADCVTIAQPQFSFSVRSPSGDDLTGTAFFVVRRLDGSPPVPVDSVFGRQFEVAFRFQNVPGRFHITISHEGYTTEDLTVFSVPDPWAGDCGPAVKHQSVTVTLAPRTSSSSEPRGSY